MTQSDEQRLSVGVTATDAAAGSRQYPSLPLYQQVLIGVVAGTALGMAFGQGPYLGGLRNEDLGRLGTFVILSLKTLAIPLIFFAVLDAVLRANLPLRQGLKLLVICLINVTVAMTIGLTVMNVWKPGLSWSDHLDELFQTVPNSPAAPNMAAGGAADSLHPLTDLLTHIPHSMVRPFTTNNVIGIVLLALVTGVLLRWVRNQSNTQRSGIAALATIVEKGYGLLMQVMGWIIRVIPLAVFGALAYVVGRAGIGVFSLVWVFLAVTMLGLALHSLVYYPLVAWLIGKKSPSQYIGQGADAITTALSCNSSLATVPVTLKCLERMHVSPESARLAACVGTNLNNDGVALYEAMAALFLAQALGFDVPMVNQLLIVMASVMAGIGVAGIPEAGLIVLPLVLSAAGLPNHIIVSAIPLILTVDWIIARARSGVNVMSDLLVAILLDVGRKPR